MSRILQAIVRATSIFTVLLLASPDFCAATPPQAKEPAVHTGEAPQLLPMPAKLSNPTEPCSPFSVFSPNPYAAVSHPQAAPVNPYAGPLYANSPAAGPANGIPTYSNPYLPAPGGNSGTARKSYNPRTSPQVATPPLLETFGLPTVKGRLGWPLGLRILAPALEAEDLRFQINGLMQTLAQEAAEGHVRPGTVELAARTTAELRRLFRASYGSTTIAEYTQREANHFLNRLDTAIRSATAMKASSESQR